eukprot:g13202.t1
MVDEPDVFHTALRRHFAEAGFVAKLPSSRPGSVHFLVLVQRMEQGVCIEVTDCEQGLFRDRLDAAKLQQLRQDAGMAEFAWPTFLRLLAQALRGEDGCSTTAVVMGGGPPKLQLEFRFRLQSAVLLARMQMEVSFPMMLLDDQLMHRYDQHGCSCVACANAGRAAAHAAAGGECPSSAWAGLQSRAAARSASKASAGKETRSGILGGPSWKAAWNPQAEQFQRLNCAGKLAAAEQSLSSLLRPEAEIK